MISGMEMNDFNSLELPALVDMLAKQATVYARMVADGDTGEKFSACQTTLILLQSEIICRTAMSPAALLPNS